MPTIRHWIAVGSLLLAAVTTPGTQPVTPEAMQALARNQKAFAIDLYGKLRTGDGNLFFSPYSISSALAMTAAGARGETAAQMAKSLRFSLGQTELHPAFAELQGGLNKIQEARNVQLAIANALWPDRQYPFLPDYLSLVKQFYGADIAPLDYAASPEAARVTINQWVESRTRDKIRNLIPAGLLSAQTRLVLVNAIYFKGDWARPFKPDKTQDAPFFLSTGKTVPTPLMEQKDQFKFADLDALQLLELSYAGDELSMLVLLPKTKDGLPALEAAITADSLTLWKGRLRRQEVRIFLPKWKLTSEFRLDSALQSLGMTDAFAAGKADFSGMDGRRDLFLGAVVHKAFVDVNEEGTEAAAATGAVMTLTAAMAPPPTFRAEHPFVFLIQDNQTGSILFFGRVTDPTQGGE